MIPGVAEWVRTLIVLALLATLMEWLLPVGDLKRYATLVAGLIILLALIGPVWGLVRGLARANASRWLGTSSPSRLGQLVRRQERQEVSAVVESLPGVDGVTVTPHPGGVDVAVWGAHMAPGVAAAARAAVEEVMQVPAGQVHVVVQPAPGHREGRAGNEAQLAH
ncbi:MAG: stage III sporulation protein AF [Thermaerobacter sp.]|nr:stage III sporulation protein AF [Thermaerobacter sp.]